MPGNPPALVNSSAGVTFLPSENDGRSNGLINDQLGPANHGSFRSQGTFSVDIFGDRADFVGGTLAGDNFGFNQFGNGQGTIGFFAGRQTNGPGLHDDQLVIAWNSWHSSVWYNHGSATLEFDRWYDIGFTWLGPDNRFEIWVNGVLKTSDNTSPNTPWGSPGLGLGSGYNFGLGDNHMRGIDADGSASHLTFSNLATWNEHRQFGDTTAIPEPSALGLSVIFAWLMIHRRCRRFDRVC